MSSIFTGKAGLRHQYEDLTYAQVDPATNAASSLQLIKFDQASRMLFLDNTLDVDLALYLVHPDADSTVPANRLLWMELPALRVLNYNISQAGLTFDPGARLYVSKAPGAGAATTGKIRVSTWG